MTAKTQHDESTPEEPEKPRLADLLARCLDEDDLAAFDERTEDERERWDEDEGSSGG